MHILNVIRKINYLRLVTNFVEDIKTRDKIFRQVTLKFCDSKNNRIPDVLIKIAYDLICIKRV